MLVTLCKKYLENSVLIIAYNKYINYAIIVAYLFMFVKYKHKQSTYKNFGYKNNKMQIAEQSKLTVWRFV